MSRLSFDANVNSCCLQLFGEIISGRHYGHLDSKIGGLSFRFAIAGQSITLRLYWPGPSVRVPISALPP